MKIERGYAYMYYSVTYTEVQKTLPLGDGGLSDRVHCLQSADTGSNDKYIEIMLSLNTVQDNNIVL